MESLQFDADRLVKEGRAKKQLGRIGSGCMSHMDKLVPIAVSNSEHGRGQISWCLGAARTEKKSQNPV